MASSAITALYCAWRSCLVCARKKTKLFQLKSNLCAVANWVSNIWQHTHQTCKKYGNISFLFVLTFIWKLHKVWQGRLWQLPSRDALMLFKYWASGYKLQFETKMWDLCIANHAIMSLLFQLKNLNLIYLNTWHSGREQGITSLSLCEILLLRFCFKFDSDFYLTLNFLPIWQNGHWSSNLTHTFVSICAFSAIYPNSF